jgi:predicted Zn-dependent peptidase
MDIPTTYQKTTLPNGLTIITENIPTVRSVSAGVWIKAGTRQETKEINGAAHFLEHMLFKGTERRTARTIARSLESIGGYLNAFTGKEQTCFYAEFLDEHLSKAIDILSDIVCYSTLPPIELEKERMVILDEIGSVEDTPDDLLQDIFVEKIYPDNSLGFPILGTRETVLNLTRDQILKFYHSYYTFENIIIAAAGNIQHEKLVEFCLNKFDLPHRRKNPETLSPVKTSTGEVIIPRTVNQAHVCLGTVGLPYQHHQKYELLLLNTILGVGMGSRLFQNIREKY